MAYGFNADKSRSCTPAQKAYKKYMYNHTPHKNKSTPFNNGGRGFKSFIGGTNGKNKSSAKMIGSFNNKLDKNLNYTQSSSKIDSNIGNLQRKLLRQNLSYKAPHTSKGQKKNNAGSSKTTADRKQYSTNSIYRHISNRNVSKQTKVKAKAYGNLRSNYKSGSDKNKTT
jgi:hypothetical protein